MARAGCRTNGLQKIEGDDVEKSLELLDKVLSEFEDPDSLPHIEPESPSQGNQSEDDGYMSMNGRRAKIPLEFYNQQHEDYQQNEHHEQEQQQQPPPQEQQEQKQFLQSQSEISEPSPVVVMGPHPVNPSTETQPEERKSSTSSSSLSPQKVENIISNLIPSPRTSPSKTTTTIIISDENESKNKNRINNAKNLQKRQSSDIEDVLNLSNDVVDLDRHQTSDINIIESRKTHDTNVDCNNDFSTESSANLSQTTLPKIRPSTIMPSKYSSLPCNGPAKGIGHRCGGNGSLDGERNILGIDIRAVHDAVLRSGVAKLPEPILNEHPVTIYPGRDSPPRTSKVPPRTLPGSIERHREVCRNINSSISSTNDDEDEDIEFDQIDSQLISPLQRLVISKSPSSPLVSSHQHHQHPQQFNIQNNLFYNYQHNPQQYQQQIDNHYTIHNNSFSNSSQVIDNKNLINSLFIHEEMRNSKVNKRRQTDTDDSEEFSDDSLEGQSLPPPPPPPVVPPPPSLSAPVTPSKRGSIAWEINLDDHLPSPPSPLQQHQLNNATATAASFHLSSTKKKIKDKPSRLDATSPAAKIITRRRGRSMSGSQSSLISTPANSVGSLSNNHSSPQHQFNNKLQNRANSVEWPEPPDPPICSTEDEAASIYSDSDELISAYPTNMIGQGTYVIRKGRKERQRLPELNSSMSSSVNSKLSNEGNFSNHSQNSNLLTPNSRHSIDLGATSHTSITTHPVLSPRSRLSLDLSSPNTTSEFPHNTMPSTISGTVGIVGGLLSNNGMMVNNMQQNAAHYPDFKTYGTSPCYDVLQIHETTANESSNTTNQMVTHSSNGSLNNNLNNGSINGGSNPSLNGSLTRGQQQVSNDVMTTSTPRRELAPPIEEDEEQDSESQRGAPLRQIENNISALLRGDIAVARVGDIALSTRRPLAFRPGVHKSESAKEMLLSQTNIFGPLPPSPPTSSPEPEVDGFPPLPPSPQENIADDEDEPDEDVLRGMHGLRLNSRTRLKTEILQFNREEHPPAVPPHRATPSLSTLKTRSMDAGYTKKYSNSSSHCNSPGTLPSELQTTNSRRRLMSGAFPKRSAQSPREEKRLQTSCSLPETPIFARGCDIPRTPHRRGPENPTSTGSRTAPRTNPPTTPNTNFNSSIIGIGSTLGGGGAIRQHSINQALASGEMLRLAGGPARGWYPKQRNMRPASTEHLDRLHRTQGSMRAWESGGMMHGTGGNRKPLTLPPNLTPKFFNKSPREALRRVTSLLIRKGNGKDKEKETKREKEAFMSSAVHRSPGSAGDIPIGQTTFAGTTDNRQHKKKGFFKSFWKKSKHYSLDQ